VTAPVQAISTNLAAWQLVSNPLYVPDRITARQAIAFAAEATIADPDWLHHDGRYATLREIVHIGALPNLDDLFERLICEIVAGFGPRISAALNALTGGRS
jgi:hypothetical protein